MKSLIPFRNRIQILGFPKDFQELEDVLHHFQRISLILFRNMIQEQGRPESFPKDFLDSL